MNIYSFSGSASKPLEKARMKKLLGPQMIKGCLQSQNVLQEKKKFKQAKVAAKQRPSIDQPSHERIKINSFHSLGMICNIGRPRSPVKAPPPPPPPQEFNGLFDFASPYDQNDELNCTEDSSNERTYYSQSTNLFSYPLAPQKRVKFLLPEESPRKSSLGDSYTQLFAQPIAINTSINLPELYEISEAYVIDPHYLTDYEDLTQDDRQHQLLQVYSLTKSLGLSKQTFFAAIEYFDRLLDRSRTRVKINAENFALYATVCLSLASKHNESRPPKIELFLNSLPPSDSATISSFIQVEIQILQILKWTLHPVTHMSQMFQVLKGFEIFSTSNHSTFYLCQYAEYVKSHIMTKTSKAELSESFVRLVNKTLEITLFDYESLIYPQQSLCFSILYLLAGIELNSFKTDPPTNDNPYPQCSRNNNANLRNIHSFRNQSRFLFEESPQNAYFKSFLKHYNSSLNELLPTIQYVSTFLAIKFKKVMNPVSQSILKKNLKMQKKEILQQKKQIDNSFNHLDFY